MNHKRVLSCTTAALLTALAASGGAQADSDGVHIGVMSDMSGLYSDLGGPGSLEAARMAAEDHGGEVLGEPVEISSADHQNDAGEASTIAREWIDEDGVDAIFGVPNSSAALAVQEITRKRERYFFNSGAATTALTNDQCSPTGVHYTYDTHSLAQGTGKAVVNEGGDSWYFLTADYEFGHSLENDVSDVVEEAGGEVLGSSRHPLDEQDFSSYLLSAQSSGAEIIGLANAGTDATNSIRQAEEFGITQAGQQLAGLLLFITDIHSIGLDAAQGLTLTTGFYWDRNEETREFAERFEERTGQMPTMVHAGVYSAASEFFKAVDEVGDVRDTEAVMEALRDGTIDDFFADGGHIREDGRMVHDMYLAEVKAPDESEGEWDYYDIVRTIPGDEAYQSLDDSTCELVN